MKMYDFRGQGHCQDKRDRIQPRQTGATQERNHTKTQDFTESPFNLSFTCEHDFLNDRRIASHPLQSPQTNKTQQQITGNVNIRPGWAAGTKYERYHLPSALVHARIDLRSCILLACILTAQPGQVRFFTGWEASFCFPLSSRQNPPSSLRKSCRLIWRVRKENPTDQPNKKLWWILPFYYFILDVRNQYSAVNCIWWVTSNPIIHYWCFSWDFSKGSSSLAQTLGTVSAWHLNMVMCI